jgi:GGDEF domain-containing protein
MGNSGGEVPDGTKEVLGRVLNRDLFLFLLDLEVKRARRYQNFICLMLLKIKQFTKTDNGWDFPTCHEILSDLLSVEIRESDILGSLDGNKLIVLLPYADVKAGNHAKSRFEETLKYYNFKNKGFEIAVDQICFPMDGTNTMELIRKSLGEATT